MPEERLKAIVKAAREKDQSAIPKLIMFLDSDDPAVRLAAIRTLESLTGQTLGYDHAAPEWKRREMIQAWVEWDNRRGTPPKAPEPHARQAPQPAPGGTLTRPPGSSADTVR